jgi:hypothetical protein
VKCNPDYEADIMKILTVIILFLTMLMTGCSDSHGHKRSLWPDPQVDAARRLNRNLPERQDLDESNQASRDRH